MADVSITDVAHLTGSVKVSDQAPLSIAQLKKLDLSHLPIVSDLGKPIDQFPLNDEAVGIGVGLPAALFSGDFAPIIGGAASANLSIINSKKGKLFADDDFAPTVRIGAGECWAGLAITYTLSQGALFSAAGIQALKPAGFGATLKASEGLSLTTFIKLPVAGGVLPSFKDGLATLIQSYSVPSSAERLRNLAPGVAYVAELSGSLSASGSYSAPLALNPLAASNLPFNFALNIQPNVSASVSGTVKIDGSFAIRSYKTAPDKLVMAVYKKHEASLSASLTATSGIGVDLNTTDVLAKVMDSLAGPDLRELRLSDEQAAELNKGLKEAVDHSLALSLNACCTGSDGDEAALVYQIDLRGDDQRLDAALSAALHGDWTKLEMLPEAHCLRNIARETKERNHKISLNLLGIYNATSVADYLKSATVLYDEQGQVALTEKAEAKNLAAGTTLYAAKADRLRSALAQAFVTTTTYGAGKGKLGVSSFTTEQSFLKYQAKASASDLVPEVLLARSVQLAMTSAWDGILHSKARFTQNKFFLNIRYDLKAVMQLFYSDVEKRMPHSSDELERIGRTAKVQLLDPASPSSMARRKALTDDKIWKAMTECGNISSFASIAGLAKLAQPALAAISADYLDIRWWSGGMTTVVPTLTTLLQAVDDAKSLDPTKDPAFLKAAENLRNALLDMQSKTHSAFGDGWPLSVMFQLASEAGAQPSVQMDIGWNGKFEHYQSDAAIGVGQHSGD